MPQRIRAVLLDAVGTALYPAEDVAETYAAFGRQQGSQLTTVEIGPRFREAFGQMEQTDRERELTTNETRELARWNVIVAKVFVDVPDISKLFVALWDHYARPTTWRVFPDIVPFLHAARSLDVILASNFDARLRTIVAGLPELQGLKGLAISSELGWRKPSPKFYQRILDEYRLSPEEVIAIGDDPANDVAGASAVGITAFLLDRQGKIPGENVYPSLTSVSAKLQSLLGMDK